ncbi:MAG: hypothetical protein R3B90_05775 [Planctomycetaceae bacterium]
MSKRNFGRATVIAGGLLLLAFLALVLRRGENLERRLMRAGGGIVSMATNRPGRTLTGLAVVLAVTWTGLAIAAIVQRRPAGGGGDPS